MASGMSRRNAPVLTCIIEALVDEVVIVELKGDTIYKGKLAHADKYMNLRLVGAKEGEPVTVKRADGSSSRVAEVDIQGVNVRYVHMSPKIDVVRQVEDQRERAAKQQREMQARHNVRAQRDAEERKKRARGPEGQGAGRS